MTNREILEARVAGFETGMLKSIAVKAMSDPREECDIILDMVMDELFNRLPEADYIAFSDSL